MNLSGRINYFAARYDIMNQKLLFVIFIIFRCDLLTEGTEFCPEETDEYTNVRWPQTAEGSVRTTECPETFVGSATRYCGVEGWDEPDYSMCYATTIEGLAYDAYLYYNYDDPDLDGTIYFIEALLNFTTPPPDDVLGPFLTTSELACTYDTLEEVVDFLTLNQSFVDLVEVDSIFVNGIYQIVSNAVDIRNTPSWKELIAEYNITGAQILIVVERYSGFIGQGVPILGEIVQFSALNIGVSIETVVIDEDAVFPKVEEFGNTMDISNGSIRIPSQYLSSAAANGSTYEMSAAFSLFPTLQDFLPSDTTSTSTSENTTVGSVILSAQLISDSGSMEAILATAGQQPVELNFTITVPNDAQNFTATCVFWKFSSSSDESTSSGGWLSDGIVTEVIDNSTVRCLSNHLTSFAVLVDVSGTHSTTPPSLEALSYVSYIGIGLSVVCLIVAIVFLLSHGKELFVKVHNFLHLNLCFALLCGFIVFIAGVTHASRYEILCKLVAILLHYFFLSAFCWMLCEAILLYFLVVIVFTSINERWYVFLLIGWIVPLVYVVVIFGVFHDEYIEQPTRICWLSYFNHVIWSFIAPMCLIIVINTIVIVVAIIQVYRTKKRMSDLNRNEDNTSRLQENTKIAITLIKGVVILLPLLGITWVVGLFALNENTLFFAWIFTILNSLQGVFLLVFHVLMNEKKLLTRTKKLFMKDEDPWTVQSTMLKSRNMNKSEEDHTDTKSSRV